MRRKTVFILLPAGLITTTSLVFYFGSALLGNDLGYLSGFLFYWLFWCLIIPVVFFKKNIKSLFKNKKPLFSPKNWWVILLFLATIISPVFMYFLPRFSGTPTAVVLLAIPLAAIHGFFEELFWRGLYVQTFPFSRIWGVVIPSIFFTLWHIAPQFAIPSDNLPIFLLSTLPLGFTYGIVAFTTKSAKWSAIGHSVSGFFAFSGLLAPSLYNLF